MLNLVQTSLFQYLSNSLPSLIVTILRTTYYKLRTHSLTQFILKYALICFQQSSWQIKPFQLDSQIHFEFITLF